MTYEQARAYVQTISKSGSILGLASMKNLMQELSDVQKQLKIIHIAGTNGKGSVGAYLEWTLKEAGFRVGRYTSPAVFEPLEVWRINCENITKEDYSDTMEQVKRACDNLVKKGNRQPTVFEVETALAFLYFYEKKCDYVLLETGMGGETDATNIIKQPVCSVLTSISMDHMQFLGSTLEEIAKAKAGIIKEGCPVVCADQSETVMHIIRQKAGEVHAPLKISDSFKAQKRKDTLEKLQFDFLGIKEITSYLTGAFQLQNACLAVCVLKEILNLPDEIIKKGMEKTVWHGRFELVGTKPFFILDGAHNEDAAKKLRASMQNYFTNSPITYIIGVLRDKEHKKMLECMIPLADCIYTVTPENARAMPAEELAHEAEECLKRCGKKSSVAACSSVLEAVKLAKEQTPEYGVILAFGSLSYLREVKQSLE